MDRNNRRSPGTYRKSKWMLILLLCVCLYGQIFAHQLLLKNVKFTFCFGPIRWQKKLSEIYNPVFVVYLYNSMVSKMYLLNLTISLNVTTIHFYGISDMAVIYKQWKQVIRTISTCRNLINILVWKEVWEIKHSRFIKCSKQQKTALEFSFNRNAEDTVNTLLFDSLLSHQRLSPYLGY